MEQAEEPGTRQANHLVGETSPYLLQHAYNPVDWRPWGDEAIEHAKAENKPIFLSIGYAACHWCHVMERESFEDEAIAAFLNEHFVSIKVDREERPDLDTIYMTAVQLLTGNGGWPMSVFLTPDLEPFYGGTYFPPRDMYGRPGFMTLIHTLADAWAKDRSEVVKNAKYLTEVIGRHAVGRGSGAAELGPELLAGAVEALRGEFDRVEGGFGAAPKFPPSAALALLLRQYGRAGAGDTLRMAALTLDKMALGGMYDQLGGGFHRYSTDAEWLVPHFEKMLYDNALLAQVYLEAYQLTRKPLYKRVAAETLDYVLRDMTDETGAFHSSEDADSEGEEGRFYLWTLDQIEAVLGAADGRAFAEYYGVREGGNFTSGEPYHAGQNVLHVPDAGAPVEGLEAMRAKLLERRNTRVRPGKDDKIVTSWNGLMISALAQGFGVLGDSRYRDAAVAAARFILDNMRDEDGRLLRTYRGRASTLPGYLDDYAFMVSALLDVYEATFDVRWLEAAGGLTEEMVTRFRDEEAGGFFFNEAGREHVLVRTKSYFDGAEPSGNAMAALGLLRLARMLDKAAYADMAEQTVAGAATAMARSPQAVMKMLCAVDWLLHAPREVALVGPRASAEMQAFLEVLRRNFLPNRIVVWNEAGDADSHGIAIPLLAGKTLVDGKPAAYVCKDFACKAPAVTAEAFRTALDLDAKEEDE